MIPETKLCKTCGGQLPLPSFYRGRGKYGVLAHCKTCTDAARKLQPRSDKDRARERAYFQRNREKRREQKKRSELHHHETRQERNQRFRDRHKEALAEQQRQLRAENPDHYAALSNSYRARSLNAPGDFTGAQWAELKARYDHRCLNCGRQEPEIKLTVDHIVPMLHGGTNDISNIQPLCGRCNNSKYQKHTDFRPQQPEGSAA